MLYQGAARVTAPDYMPILGTPLLLPMRLLNEEWAQRNHGQSLARLAERGGLDLAEAAAIHECRRWRAMTADEAIAALRAVEARA